MSDDVSDDDGPDVSDDYSARQNLENIDAWAKKHGYLPPTET